jgi:formylglycine-generating enzyme required for sulfatase activity
VTKVSWEDDQRFNEKLNQLTGKAYRLPTEVEWEYATQSGQLSHGYLYSGSDTLNNVAWYLKNSGKM